MNYTNMSKYVSRMEYFIGRKFIPGKTDCNIMLLDVIDEMYGTEYKKLAFGKYTTIEDGFKRSEEMTGCKFISELISGHIEEIQPQLACIGDIAIEKNKWESVFFHVGDSMIEANEKAGKITRTKIDFDGVKVYRFKGLNDGE